MVDCNKVLINNELYEYLSDLANPCSEDWIKTKLKKTDQVYRVSIAKQIPNLRKYYTVKVNPLTASAITEKQTLFELSIDMIEGRAPLLFPCLYKSWVCGNDQHLLLQPADQPLSYAIEKGFGGLEWWAEVLYQLSKAVYHLEDKRINHNNLNLETIAFQNLDEDYNNLALMIIDFDHVLEGDDFVLGRDLNMVLHRLIYDQNLLPLELANLLIPNLKESSDYNPKTSGQYISRLLANHYPHVTDYCSTPRLKKLYGAGIGAVVGDALGMPLEFDYDIEEEIREMHKSADFNGLSAAADLPAGTFTDDTQMSLALIDAIVSDHRALIPSTVAKEFKGWFDSGPIDVGVHTTRVFSLMLEDGSDWEQISSKVHGENPDSAANGAVMRTWPVAILYHQKNVDTVAEAALKQSHVSHMNSDAAYAAVFVSCLIHELINGKSLKQAIKTSLPKVKDHISGELYDALTRSSKLNYTQLEGGTGWIVDTMRVVMWSIQNTNSFEEALIKAVNVSGDSDTNGSITGAIAGAMYGFDSIPEKWLDSIDSSSKNIWKGRKITVADLMNRLANLAQC